MTGTPTGTGSPQVSPQVTVTPNADGGVTVQTWTPESVVNGVPQSWTVQTVTINNSNIVTNSTITTNVLPGSTTPPPSVTAPTSPTSDGTGTDPGSPQPPVECGSLSCESTQQGVHTDTTAIAASAAAIKQDTAAILTELQANGAPTLPDQAAIIQSQKDIDVQKQTDIPAQIAAARSTDAAMWFAWVWTPPTGTCEAPVANLSRGVVVAFNYCPWVASGRELIGWLFALFGAWSIYGEIFRRSGP
jgi:hypothetical protein